MPTITLLSGLLLVAVGAIGYFFTASHHWTALIPAFFGVPLLALGGLAAKLPGARKHFMHAAVVISLLGVLGGLGMSVPKLPLLIAGEEIPRFNAFLSQLATGLVCLVHLVMGIRSFIAARKAAQKSS
jgi:hypothetical protein